MIIYGAGGFGREVRLMIEQINTDRQQWNVVGFVDDEKKSGSLVDDMPVLGGIEYLLDQIQQVSIVLAVADSYQRKQITQKLKLTRHYFPTLIHPNARMGDLKRNTFGEGTIIADGNILTTSVTLGKFVILNLSCTVGHDVRLADFISIMPGCGISGNVLVGEGTLVGTGARLLQNLSIGAWCKIGAGAVVTKSYGDNLTLTGVPAKPKQ